MKNILLLSVCILCSIGASAQFSGKGSGTSDDPYQITNADELFEVRNALTASYKLMNDINLTDWINDNNSQCGWIPINNFSGFFDGNGKTISGLYINRSTENYIGLFGIIGTGTVCNTIIKEADITGNDEVGVIAGEYLNNSNAIFNNVVVNSKVSGTKYIGGIVGRACIVSSNSVINVNIKGDCYIGGVVGYASEFATASGYYRGQDTQITNNIVISGSIFGKEYVGGIMGYVGGRNDSQNYPGKLTNTFSNNYSSIQIIADKYVGGICGYAPCSYYFQGVKGSTYGEYSSKLVFSNNSFRGKIICQNYAGGIIGYIYKDGSIKQVRFQYILATHNIVGGIVIGEDDTNGIVGRADWFSNPSSCKNNLSNNVCVADTISDSQGIPFRLWNYIECDNNASLSNYALSPIILLSKGSEISKEDDYNNGIGVGKTLLKKKSMYEGLGFDFESDWAIVEGETYPYNINQSRPATVTSFKSGTAGSIDGNAMGKSSKCNGYVYITIGENFYEGVVTDGQWSVDLGEVKEGAEAKVTVMVDGMMPSITTTVLAEKGSETPSAEDIVVTDISSLEDVIYSDKTTALKGSNGTLTISMKNAQATSAYSFDLVLPDGVTVDSYTLSSRHNGHAETMNRNETTGVYSFAVLSLQSKEIKENDGVIWTLKLNVADNVEAGDYAVKIQNAKYSLTSGSTSVVLPEVTSLLTIEDYIKGDANGDSTVDIADAVCIVNHVVGKDAPTFVEASSDANGDGVVDIADAVRIVNLVVGKIDALAPKMILNNLDSQ